MSNELSKLIGRIIKAPEGFLDQASLEEARKALPEERTLIDHRDRAYDLSRQAELLYEDAKNSMDVAVIRRADEQASSTHQMTVAAHRLNMLAAMFFPFATLGAIFGTTLTDNWSWSHSALPFILFLMTGLLIGLTLAQFIARPANKQIHEPEGTSAGLLKIRYCVVSFCSSWTSISVILKFSKVDAIGLVTFD